MTPIELLGEPQRFILAAAACALYALLCTAIWRRRMAKHRSTARLLAAPATGTSHWLIAYASQTGTAEEIATQTAGTLHLSGIAVQLSELSALDAGALANAERVLFVVSTYGEGNPPDNAARFAQRVMGSSLPLRHLHYAVLALGDRSYANFCDFGQALAHWLQAQGAQPLFPVIEVDRGDAVALEAWRTHLSHLAGTDDAPDWQAPRYEQWQLAHRRLLNPGSQGHGVYHLEFEPVAGAARSLWEAGDLAQVRVPGDPEQPREYSVASIPDDGRLHLLVRLQQHPDGTFGAASGWLTQTLQIGEPVPLRLRPHARFRLGDNAARPLILIGNGSGIAGLRGHLKNRAGASAPASWLIFGERNQAHDYHYRDEIERWVQAGVLQKLDMVFSRDQAERRYVQDRLLEVGPIVRDWINQGAAIYVCGSLKGMAGGVDAALALILGRAALEELAMAGRYRRDVY